MILFYSFLKVVDSSPTQSEKTVGRIISSCRTKYASLQDMIQAIVSDFNAYSFLMKVRTYSNLCLCILITCLQFVAPVLGEAPFDDFATRVSPLAKVGHTPRSLRKSFSRCGPRVSDTERTSLLI